MPPNLLIVVAPHPIYFQPGCGVDRLDRVYLLVQFDDGTWGLPAGEGTWEVEREFDPAGYERFTWVCADFALNCLPPDAAEAIRNHERDAKLNRILYGAPPMPPREPSPSQVDPTESAAFLEAILARAGMRYFPKPQLENPKCPKFNA